MNGISSKLPDGFRRCSEQKIETFFLITPDDSVQLIRQSKAHKEAWYCGNPDVFRQQDIREAVAWGLQAMSPRETLSMGRGSIGKAALTWQKPGESRINIRNCSFMTFPDTVYFSRK